MFQPLKLDGDDVRRTLQMLKDIDSDSVKILRKELRSALKPLAQDIANQVPRDEPISGFAEGGATAWSPTRASVSFRAGKRRKGGPWSPLVSLEISSKPAALRGIYIGELAGTRNNPGGWRSRSKGWSTHPSGIAQNGQGAALIAALQRRKQIQGKGGRYIYQAFRLQRSDAVRIAEGILKRFWDRVDRKLR